MRIEVTIDELVLHGFDPRQRHAIADAVERELSRLMRADAALLPDWSAISAAHADAGAFNVAASASAVDVGTGIARAVITATRGSAG
jgi:hypothetical protein